MAQHVDDPATPEEREWRYDDWAAALCERFFSEEAAGLPVLFFIDEVTLADLHPSGDGETAVASLSSTVRLGLAFRDPKGCFRAYEDKARRWKIAGGEGCPPMLPLLAVCVLAATRMGSGSVSPQNYRHHLCALLGLPDDKMPDGFYDSMYILWGYLDWWLEVKHRGERGRSTIVEDSHFTHIGYPLSQTLFRTADRSRLDEFFRWFGLVPGEALPGDELVSYFRAWTPDKGLSPGAHRMLERSEYAPTLGRILTSYALQWDGTRSARTGSRNATLRIVLDAFPTIDLAFGALQPDGFPDRLSAEFRGRTIHAEASDGVYEVARVKPNDRVLRAGVTFRSGDCTLAFPGAPIHVLALDESLGGWSNVDTLAPGERHWILVAPEVWADTARILRANAQPDWRADELRADELRGWRLVRDVVVESAASGGSLGDLDVLRPTNRHRIALTGGLPLSASGSYMLGGLPDLWLPPAPDGSAGVQARLDGQLLPGESAQVRLADFVEDAGSREHTLVIDGGARRALRVIQPSLCAPPKQDLPSHDVVLGDDGSPSVHRPAGRGGDQADIRISGAYVSGPAVPARRQPVLLKRQAAGAWLLGANPTELEPVSAPPAPSWLGAVNLSARRYEHVPTIDAVWAIEEWQLEPIRRARLLNPVDPIELGETPTETMLAWAEMFLAETEVADDARDLWEMYGMLALEIVEGRS
jgi:hypothetical protein